MKGKVLLLGIGNPSRKDDGLGPALAARFDADCPAGVVVDANYQLSLEDACTLSEYEKVVILDASAKGDGAFTFEEVEPDPAKEFSTHLILPPSILSIAREFFQAEGLLYVLGMRGYDFESFEEGLTEVAAANLEKSEAYLRGWLIEQG